MQAINDRYSKVIIASDLLITIQTINGDFDPPKNICNLVQDIIILAKNVDNICFVFCKRTANELADRISIETIHAYKFGSCNC